MVFHCFDYLMTVLTGYFSFSLECNRWLRVAFRVTAKVMSAD